MVDYDISLESLQRKLAMVNNSIAKEETGSVRHVLLSQIRDDLESQIVKAEG